MENTNTATTYKNIGLVYKEQGNYKKGLDYLSKAYQIRKKILGDNHPETKNVLESVILVKKYMS